MRASRAQAAENRQNVIESASRLFRQHGFDGIGLKDLMREAGLTQGGFYKQFASKDDLIAHAAGRALDAAGTRWQTSSTGSADPLKALVDFYLSLAHRDQPSEGCPVVALGGDVARKGPEVKAQFEAGIRGHQSQLSALLGQEEDRALAMLSTMVGAMVLSRAVQDETLSQRVLEVARESLLQGRDNDHGAGSQ